MCLLFETIKLENGELVNLEYHQKRFELARQKNYCNPAAIELRHEISIPDFAKTGLFRCRITYGENIDKTEFISYQYRKIESLKIVVDDSIDYTYKYEDRTHLKNLFEQRGNCDDIIIVKNKKVTDSFAGNLVFFDGTNWFTPNQPLLRGTQRQYLLDTNRIFERQILLTDIFKYQKAGIINAFYSLENMSIVESTNISPFK